MFDSVDTVYDVIRIATGVLSTIKIRPDRMLKGEAICMYRGRLSVASID